MNRFFSKLAIAAVLANVIAGQAQAQPGYPNSGAQKKGSHVVWHYSPKSGAPYGVWVPNDVATQTANPAPKATHLAKQKKTDVARCNTDTRKLAC